MTKNISLLLFSIPLFVACGASEPSQKLPGPTSADRLGLQGEILESVSFTYREDGRIFSRVSNGEELRFYHDHDGRLTFVEISAPDAEEADEELAYHYDGADRVARIDRQELSTGRTIESTRFVYDDSGRVARREDLRPFMIGGPKEEAFAYQYDSSGRLVFEKPMVTGLPVKYGYVNNGVLRHRDTGDVRKIFEHDAFGNVLAESVVSAGDESRVQERWVYGFEGWSELSDNAKDAPMADTSYLSASVR
jgi:hypothetical protein